MRNNLFQCPGPIGNECKQRQHTCASDNLLCYVIDSNAYVVLSEDKKYTGYFFGEIHGHIMEQLIAQNIFWQAHIYDYQGACFVEVKEKTEANSCSALKNVRTQKLTILNELNAVCVFFLMAIQLVCSQCPIFVPDVF